MRAIMLAGLLLLSSGAQAAEIHVETLPMVAPGLTKLAVAYTSKTGVVVTVKSNVIGKVISDIKSGDPTIDVVALPTDLMDGLDKEGGLKAGSKIRLARVEIALAVRAGAPHPDISTVARLRDVLAAGKLVYSQPGPPRNSAEAAIIDALLKRPEFASVHPSIVPMDSGSGISALARGEGEMALQVIPEILPVKGVELVAPLPPELGAHIDTAAAILSRSANEQDAAAFLRFVASPDAAPIWKSEGVASY